MKSIYFMIEKFVFCSLATVVLAGKCTTPNGEEAECVSIRSCPILNDALDTLQPQAVEFVKKSQCGQAKYALVCCGTSLHLPTSSPTSMGATNKMDLLPTRSYCGYQRFDDYFHSENDSSVPSIDEFPWSAALVYERRGRSRSIACSGSLISNRYVLTVAHCILIPSNHYKIVGVTLGEYNVAQDEDCVRNGRFGNECAEPIGDFGIEEIITHPGYNRESKAHDIGLIRLNNTVTYSDFIRPICLPFLGTKFAKTGDFLYSSGWGVDSSTSAPTNIKKKITVELILNERCREYFKDDRFANITDHHTCTRVPDLGSPVSCQGDSGGPVMFFNRNQWHQEGIISFGRGCRHEDTNAVGRLIVNIKVEKYLDWILESIRP